MSWPLPNGRATVVTSNALAIAYAPPSQCGGTNAMDRLYERIAFSAYFLWLTVLAGALWRRRAVRDRSRNVEHRTRASALPTPRA
jgi:hypothetical protein